MKTPQQMIEEYLGEIRTHLPAESRGQAEFLAEIRSHLEEELSGMVDPSPADTLNMLERFGDPTAIAEGFADDCTRPARVTTGRTASYPPAWLVIALTVIIWPVGVLLAWLSPEWRVRDKVVATLIPLLAFGLPILGGFVMYQAGPAEVIYETVNVRDMATAPGDTVIIRGPGGPNVALLVIRLAVIGGVLGSPIISAIYLAALRRDPQ